MTKFLFCLERPNSQNNSLHIHIMSLRFMLCIYFKFESKIIEKIAPNFFLPINQGKNMHNHQ
jgi:hypothetical protein